jgi:ethanolaminephosphotransferase
MQFTDYLGLDHIGHVEGPSSKLVPSKLQEMDSVIRLIHEKISEWVKNNKKFIVLYFN